MRPNPNVSARYDDAPRIVIWEMTRACALACRHCRADAIPRRDSGELTTAQAFHLVEDVAACGKPIFVLTGGDPLMRDDIFKIIEYGTSLDLPMSISPSATGRLTRTAIRKLASAGVRRMSLSLDAANDAEHDAFRGVKGSFARTVEAVTCAQDYGIGVQINTTVAQHNYTNLSQFEALLTPLGIGMWTLFFVLPVGRAGTEMCLDAQATEQVFSEIAAIAARAPFPVKTTEAPHYRRYVLQHEGALAGAPGIGDGRGFVFISHHGEIQPSGFLSLTVGNVKADRLIDVYRDDATMRRLRRPETFSGKCGACEFQNICGGSRARAYAYTGDPFASDPSCAYVPAALRAS